MDSQTFGDALPDQPGAAAPASAFPLLVAAGYLLLSVAWITYSDRLGALLFSTTGELSRFQSYKGLAYVAVTAAAMFWVARRARPRVLLPGRGARSRLSIHALLAALVAGVALPLIAVSAYGIYSTSEEHLRKQEEDLAAVTQISARAAEEFLAGRLRLMDFLVSRPPLRRFQPGACANLLEKLVESYGILQAFTVDAQGAVVCHASSDPSLPQAATRAELAVHPGPDLAVGPPVRLDNGQWGIALARPLLSIDGAAAGSLQMVLPLHSLRPLMAGTLRDGVIAGILDQDGVVIARSVDHDAYVGRTSRSGLARAVAMQRKGRITGVGPDEVERMYAFEPIPGSRWTAVTGVPTRHVAADIRSHFATLALGALLAMTVAAWLAVRVGRSIGDPILALKTTADRLRAGHLDTRAPEQGPLEVAAVGAALNKTIAQTVGTLRTLRESEARHRSLVAMAPDGIAVHEDGRIAYANPRLRQMLGLPAEERLDDAALLALTAEADRPVLALRLGQARETALEASPVPLRLHRRDGQAIEVEHSLSSVLQHGRITVQSHFLDVTERNRALAALEQSNETLEARIGERTAQLRSANGALESFSYSVAHDLRGPCGRITGFAQALNEACGAGRQERVAHYAERILANSRAAEGIIEGLLQMAQQDRSPLRVDPVCMARQIESVLEELALPATVSVQVGDLPLAYGDAASLRQVWMNLLSNAVKFCGRKPQALIQVSASAQGGQLWFHVRDNGEGFDPADSHQLFQPFQRLSGAAPFDGSGVGLAIVRRIVERHGGKVAAHGVPGEGATFSFSLPERPA